MLGDYSQVITRQANFMVAKTYSLAYNVILGQSLINAMRATISPGYLLMKFPIPQGVGQVRSNQKQARVCYVSSTKGAKGKEKSTTGETLMIDE